MGHDDATAVRAVTTLSLRVKPNARQSRLEPREDGTWVAQVKAPPIDGRANDELVALVANHFGVTRSQVSIRSGASGRLKIVRVVDAPTCPG
jgi:uncharacterized protein (TIGR00251 family)